VFLGWLNLGQVARATVRDLLQNAVWPSLVLQPDADWNPDDKELKEFKDSAEKYARPGQRGKPLTMLGGGTATVVSARIRDLIPEDILNRVESVCSAIFGIPSIILQFQVGMENSPWSQMAEARRMCYEDTIEPLWREYEKRLTRQLLRPVDKDPTRMIRFDTTEIRALQVDQKGLAEVADLWGANASLNEKRDLLGLEPSDDPKADEIPALRPPPVLPAFGDPGALPPGAEPDEDEDEEDTPPAKRAGLRAERKRRDLWAALRADMAQRAEFEWQFNAMKQLEADRLEVVRLANLHLADAKADTPTPDQRRKFIAGVRVYLEGDSQGKWEKLSRPLIQKGAERAMSALASDLGFSFDLLRPELAKYVQREAGFLIQSISKTTLQSVRDVLARGIEDGLGAREIAKGLEGLPAFTRERALLVARTESTRVTNGAPTEALKERQAATGKKYRKRWNTAGDDRVREEHAALDGETVDIDAQFSNGLDAPGEPNCRCVLTYEEVEA
jgi:SPP1 gp7 family putative phage head morphogenesis protein